MRYVQRDENGKVIGHFALLQYEGQEALADNHPDLLEYAQPQPTLAEQLNAVYGEQPVEVRARFGPLKAAVKTFLEQPEPDIEATRYLIETADISTDDEPLRQALLNCLPAPPDS